MSFFTDLGSLIMAPLYYAISAILLGWHRVLSTVLPRRAVRRGRCRSWASRL